MSKSKYTYDVLKNYIFEKQEAAKELGFEYEVWVFSENNYLVNVYK